jgi:hypothetical protein
MKFEEALTKRNTIPFDRKWSEALGSMIAALILQQIWYWWKVSEEKAFYKFRSPCHRAKPGDTWEEELGISPYEFDSSVKLISTRLKKGDSKNMVLEVTQPIFDEKGKMLNAQNLVVRYLTHDGTPFYHLNFALFSNFVIALEERSTSLIRQPQDQDQEIAIPMVSKNLEKHRVSKKPENNHRLQQRLPENTEDKLPDLSPPSGEAKNDESTRVAEIVSLLEDKPDAGKEEEKEEFQIPERANSSARDYYPQLVKLCALSKSKGKGLYGVKADGKKFRVQEATILSWLISELFGQEWGGNYSRLNKMLKDTNLPCLVNAALKSQGKAQGDPLSYILAVAKKLQSGEEKIADATDTSSHYTLPPIIKRLGVDIENLKVLPRLKTPAQWAGEIDSMLTRLRKWDAADPEVIKKFEEAQSYWNSKKAVAS